MKHKLHLLVPLYAIAVVLFQSGCTSTTTKAVKHPMHASLDWLTAEAGPVRRVNDLPYRGLFQLITLPYLFMGIEYSTPWLWEQRTIVSVSGGLPMPTVGDAYYWEEDTSPVTALRVFEPASLQWIEGTVPATGSSTNIFVGKHALELLQTFAAQALDLALEETSINISSNKDSGRLAEIRSAMTKLNQSMAEQREVLSSNLNQNGIVVFRWARKVDSKTSITAGDYGSARASKREEETGFAILGGIKIKSLQPDSSWTTNYAKMRRTLGYKFMRRVGVVTYLMQARDAVYVRDLETLRAFAVEADISKLLKDIYGPELSPQTLERLKLALSIYRSAISQLATFGAMNGIVWQDKSYSTPGSSSQWTRDRELSNSWSTIYAVLTEPKALSEENPESWAFDVSWFGWSPIRADLQQERDLIAESHYRISEALGSLKELQVPNISATETERLRERLMQVVHGKERERPLKRKFSETGIFALLSHLESRGLSLREAERAFVQIRHACREKNRVQLLPPDVVSVQCSLESLAQQIEGAR